jgi:predicted transcriptional regulator
VTLSFLFQTEHLWRFELKYRRRVDIIADILGTAANGAKKTRIMYVANLSHELLEKYLGQTINMGFVQVNRMGYEVTERGRDFLERYARFSSEYHELEGQLEKLKFEREVLERMCEQGINGHRLAKTRRITT